MTSKAYQFGFLLIVFGGFLLLGRSLFSADATEFGLFGLFIMLLGAMVGTLGLIGSSASASGESET